MHSFIVLSNKSISPYLDRLFGCFFIHTPRFFAVYKIVFSKTPFFIVNLYGGVGQDLNHEYKQLIQLVSKKSIFKVVGKLLTAV